MESYNQALRAEIVTSLGTFRKTARDLSRGHSKALSRLGQTSERLAVMEIHQTVSANNVVEGLRRLERELERQLQVQLTSCESSIRATTAQIRETHSEALSRLNQNSERLAIMEVHQTVSANSIVEGLRQLQRDWERQLSNFN